MSDDYGFERIKCITPGCEGEGIETSEMCFIICLGCACKQRKDFQEELIGNLSEEDRDLFLNFKEVNDYFLNYLFHGLPH